MAAETEVVVSVPESLAAMATTATAAAVTATAVVVAVPTAAVLAVEPPALAAVSSVAVAKPLTSSALSNTSAEFFIVISMKDIYYTDVHSPRFTRRTCKR
nr:hypothetical protein [Vibrio cholerae]